VATRVVFAEDDYLVREGVRQLLETRPELARGNAGRLDDRAEEAR
jgi:DNA-binding NarL/FixJ family response regulator